MPTPNVMQLLADAFVILAGWEVIVCSPVHLGDGGQTVVRDVCVITMATVTQWVESVNVTLVTSYRFVVRPVK